MIKIKNSCLKKANFLYWICKICGIKGNFKVNILMRCKEDPSKDYGHAWLTRNGVCYPTFIKAYHPKFNIIEIGENKKYKYWVKNKRH